MADLITAAVATLLAYVGFCWFFPVGACRKCEGSGKYRSPSGKYWRPCRRCKGSGKRKRLAAALLGRYQDDE